MPDELNDNQPGTQVVESHEGDQGDQGAGNQDSDFLSVDDRTRYRTKEDAVKGFQESGRRIAELTPWQKIAMDYGVRSPDEVAQLFDELIEARAVRKPAAAQGAEGQQASGAGNEPQTPEEQKAAKEQTIALKWLKENGVKAGYITTEQLSEVKSMLEDIQGFRQETENARFQSHVEEGRTYLSNTLDELGVKFGNKDLESKTLNLLEKALTTWINEDDSRIAAFHQGGAALAELIKLGLEESAPILNVLKNQQAANYAAQKGNAGRPAQRPAAKPLVKAAANTNQNANAKPKSKLDTGEDFSSDVHNKAWEILQAASGNSQ